MAETLSRTTLKEKFSNAWVITSDLKTIDDLGASDVVAIVFKKYSGLLVYRHRRDLEVDKILGVLGLDYVLMRRQVYDV